MEKGVKVTVLLMDGGKEVFENVLGLEPATPSRVCFFVLNEQNNVRYKWIERDKIDKIMFH